MVSSQDLLKATPALDQDFHLGLSMSGAISAGAYTAGVFDFLIQALQSWEDQKNSGVPGHRVGIKVISGASAGAITGALGVIALAEDRPPLMFDGVRPGEQKIKAFIPSLYETWVLKPAMISPDGGVDLLGLQDLDPEKPGGEPPAVISALNSRLLTEIKDEALRVKKPAAPRPYISEQLHVYMTVSNLRGIPYKIDFATDPDGGKRFYGMMSHADRVHYSVSNLGAWPTKSPFADSDASVALDVGDLFGPQKSNEGWDLYATAALASGAFPVGLAPRVLSYPAKGYGKWKSPTADAYQDKDLAGNPIDPNWPPSLSASGSYRFTCVDGGMIDNDPFEYARFSLMKDPPERNDRDSDSATRAVLMIAPFPEPPQLPPEGEPDCSLASIVSALAPALIQQARFKLSELYLAQLESVRSRFLISPHRVTLSGPQNDPEEKREKFAIACGLLSGFGGFLDQEFRDHDFQLGRRNCQKFLSDSFVFSSNNPLVAPWAGLAFAPKYRATNPQGDDGYQMIPLVGDAALTVAAADWPRMTSDDLEKRLMPRIEARLDAVLARLSRNQPKWWVRTGVRFALWSGQQEILDFIRLSILSDLILRDQIAEWVLPKAWKAPPPTPIAEDDVRAVLAELANPRFDLRNEAGLMKATKLDANVVRNILAMCQAEAGQPYQVWRAPFADAVGGPLFTLNSRKPNLLQILPGVRQVHDYFSAPSIDPPGLKGSGP